MKTNFSISIPKPCHEDWSKMSPNEKGRFCQSCSKSVIDFTEMPQQSIEEYLNNNGDKRICGRFKVSQLDQIRIEIPQHIFQKRMSFHKFFLLALLIAMGTSLLSCSDENGNTKKIDAVEVINTIDSQNCKTLITDSISTDEIIEIPEIVGEIILPPQDEIVVGLLIVENPPEFKDTPKYLSSSEKKDYLSNRITKIIKDNFNQKITEDLNLKGKQRIFTQFKIDKNGYVIDIKVKDASHPNIELEAIRVLNLLPQFIPAKQRDKNIEVIYSLPIVFVIED